MTKIKEKTELIPGTYDFMFKAIMLDESNRDYLIGIISHVTGIERKYLKDIEIQNSEHIVDNKKQKKMRSDIIASIGKKIINIEMNKYYYKGLFLKNDAYLHKISSSLYKEDEDYVDVKSVIQINFNNFNQFECDKEIYKFEYREESTNIVLPENPIKYYIDLEYLYETCYNKPVSVLSEFERYCLLLKAETKEFVKNIAGDDNIMKKVQTRIEELNEDENILGLYDAEKEAEKVMRTRIKYEVEKAQIEATKRGMEKGMKEGMEKGEKKQKQEIAKNMLKENIDVDIIIKCTGLTKEEIESLK